MAFRYCRSKRCRRSAPQTRSKTINRSRSHSSSRVIARSSRTVAARGVRFMSIAAVNVRAELPAAEAVVRTFTGPKAWKSANLEKKQIFVELEDDAQAELVEYTNKTYSKDIEYNLIQARHDHFPALRRNLRYIERELQDGLGFVVIRPVRNLDPVFHTRLVGMVISNILGSIVPQDTKGTRSFLMYDRKNQTMAGGARYSMTNEGARTGGSIHTDNVNTHGDFDYRIVSCLSEAKLGGESILVSAASVHNHILDVAPLALDPLCRQYVWEYRGFDNTEFYKAPIISYTPQNEPKIRYLREYLTSAYRRNQIPLSNREMWSMDVLDATLEMRELQFRYKLEAGEHLITAQSEILHGRTTFVDGRDANGDVSFQNPPTNHIIHRTWVIANPFQ